MSSLMGARRELKAGPLYFFDQPTARDQSKGTRILHFSLADEGAVQSSSKNTLCLNKEGDDENNAQIQSCGTMNKDNTVDTGELNVCERNPDDGQVVSDPMGAYRDAAPALLRDLARVLAQYAWPEEGCVPRGLLNILHCSSRDLTAGVSGGKSQNLNLKSRRPVVDKKTPKEEEEEEEEKEVVVNNKRRKTKKKKASSKLSFEKKIIKPRPDLPKRNSSADAHKDRANASSTISFSMSSKSCKDKGWIVEPPKLSYEEPQRSAVWQWVLQRLQAARIPIQLQATKDSERGLDKPPIVRHYGAVRSYYKNKRTVDKSYPSTLTNGMPQIPQVKREDPSQRKLHYGTNDGSSIIYYPSGGVAVCQSGSGLPCGGFYTNVFSDGATPAVVASITAFGRGGVTHPVSGVISAAWDRGGGIMYGPDGTVTKEWSWQSGSGSKETVLIQVSDSISVKLLNGTSGLLRFRSQGEIIQLPLSALSNVTPLDTSCLKPKERFVPHKELVLAKKRRPPGHVGDSKLLSVKTASVRHQEVLQMVQEVEGLEEPGAVWGGGGGGGHVEELERELRRLQRKVRNTLDDWLEFYRTATGIRCPEIERMPDAPQRSWSRREVRSAALPSLNPLEWEDIQPGPPADPPRHLSAPVDYLLRSSAGEGPRTPRKPLKEESHVTRIGALCVHSNVRLEPVIIPESPAHPPAGGASSTFSPCPALLRATVRGGEQARYGHLCCCSSRLMPLVTDLEYDAFVQGQAARSEQVLVVCVTRPGGHDTLQQLHEQRSRNRTMPCVQCQMDPFRLVRYEVSAGRTSSARRRLLQLRHNVSPGMLLMYIRGKLLFADHVSTRSRCSVRDLHKQISTTKRDYKLGLSLPADYKCSAKQKSSVAADSLTTEESQQISTKCSLSSTSLRRSHQLLKTPQQEGRNVPHIPLVTH